MRLFRTDRGAPRSLHAPSEFLSREQCEALFRKIVGMTTGGGETRVRITSRSTNTVDWARTRVHVNAEARRTSVDISRNSGGATNSFNTTRIDDQGLRYAVHVAEQLVAISREYPSYTEPPFIDEPMLSPTLWSEATYALSPEAITARVQALLGPAELGGTLSAGSLNVFASGNAAIRSDGTFRYCPMTEVECSVTVRDMQGTASGWAGVNHYDLAKIDPAAIAAHALEKCQRSANPSAVEPGRYTAILEPQAIADLLWPLMQMAMSRGLAEMGGGPFAGREPGTSKIGERVLDPRLSLSSNPTDADGPFLPFAYDGTPYRPVTWIDRGILRELSYDKGYALAALNLDKALSNPLSFRLEAAPGVPTHRVEDMIVGVARGILVTRLYDVRLVDLNSMLCEGFTRDGLWLIERGRISKAIKNFRFKESPLFALNQLEAMSAAARVFKPGFACVAPAVRVRDFNFAGLADAV